LSSTLPKHRARTVAAALGVLAVLGAVAALVLWWTRPPRVAGVRATRRMLVESMVLSGRVLPAARIELAAVGAGRVVAVHALDGQHVAAGETLAQLDAAESVASLSGAEADVRQARVRLAQARGPDRAVAGHASLQASTEVAMAEDRLARLERSGGVTPEEVVRSRFEVERARSVREAARIEASNVLGVRAAVASRGAAAAQVASARVRVEDRVVRAPCAGVLVSRDVEPGAVVAAGQRLFVLAADGPPQVRADPDESSLARLATGQPALVGPDAFPDRTFAARVSFIAAAVDPMRGTIEVRLEPTGATSGLWTDMTVSIDIEVARRPSALSVPPGALHGVGTDAPWVFVVGSGRVERRPVRLGVRGLDAVEILDGIQDGEVVLREGDLSLSPGDAVRLELE
jgi:HlyD family secretion protein